MKINVDAFYFHNFGYFPEKSFLTESTLASDLDIFLVFDLVFAGDVPTSIGSLFIGLLDCDIFIDFDLVLVCAGVMLASAEFLFVVPFDLAFPAENRILTGVSGNEGEELPIPLNLLFQGVEVIPKILF